VTVLELDEIRRPIVYQAVLTCARVFVAMRAIEYDQWFREIERIDRWTRADISRGVPAFVAFEQSAIMRDRAYRARVAKVEEHRLVCLTVPFGQVHVRARNGENRVTATIDDSWNYWENDAYDDGYEERDS
jgi:hypothetical protein